MGTILEIATSVSTPLMVAGFLAGAFFLILRQILTKGIFPSLTKAASAGLLRLIVDRLFALALTALLLGFFGFLATLFASPSSSAAPLATERVLATAESYLKSYGASTVTVVDLRIRSTDNQVRLIDKVEFDVERAFTYKLDPCPCCERQGVTGTYNIPFPKVLNGETEYMLPHSLEPGKGERIQLALGGEFEGFDACLAQIRLRVSLDSGEVAKTDTLLVLIESFDRSGLVSLDDSGNKEVKSFLEGAVDANPTVTPRLVRERFRRRLGGPCDVKPSDLPQLPNWL